MLYKIKLKNLFILSLIIVNIFFFSLIVLIEGYPETNDILHIFKITSLDGNQKYLNGIYGPGYAYYSLIFSNSLTVLSLFIFFLIISSSYLLFRVLEIVNKDLKKNEQIYIYLFSLLFHLIILTTLGFNHSDSIFFYLLYNGLLLFIIGYYLNKKKFIYLSGLALIGLSIIFRHHGPIFVFFLFCLFLYYEIFHCNKKLIANIKNYFLIILILTLPFVLSNIHLYMINASTEWQTKFKLHFYLHGDMWGDWRDLKYVLKSEHYLNFNILKSDIYHIIKITLNHIRGSLKIVYPFIICFFISYYFSKKKIVLFSLVIYLIYLFSVLPGYHRGYYPVIFISFFITLLCFSDLSKKKISYGLIFFLLFGHLIYLSGRHYEYIKDSYKLKNEINNKIVPILNSKGISYSNIFSDDYNFYTTKLSGKINKLCNWGGWFLNHPYMENYYPREVIQNKNNKYCNVRVLITKDDNFAKLYINNSRFNEYHKFEIYHLFIADRM